MRQMPEKVGLAVHEHTSSKVDSKSPPVVLIGNPNVGKSVVFGYLSGRYVTVSNFPGTTVEISRGTIGTNGVKDTIIDTPGVNNLLPSSEDERVTRDLLLRQKPKSIIQVVDSKNLKRGLLLTIQLAEMELPVVLDLNMTDEAITRGVSVDAAALSKLLRVPVIETVATRQKGLKEVGDAIKISAIPEMSLNYGPLIEPAVKKIENKLPEIRTGVRSIALMLLGGDETIVDWLQDRMSTAELEEVESIVRSVQEKFNEPLSRVITRRRMKEAGRIADISTGRYGKQSSDIATKIGIWTMHPFWGLFSAAAILYMMYQFVGVFGAGYLTDYLEGVIFAQYLSVWFSDLFSHVPIAVIRDIFVGEYGLLTMALPYSIAIILPVVVTFFIAFGILEDSGYLPRLAVMLNKVFKLMGLNGKAVLPMVLGLGCDTMATLTTRILDTKKERILVTLLLALGVPCSAQLGVIMGLLGAISISALMIWGVVVFLVLIVVGFLASKLIPDEGSDFILELPPIRVPKLSNITVKTLARTEWYLKEAVPLFFVGTLLLYLLHATGALLVIERFSSPIVQSVLGLPAKATEAFIVGFLRRDYGIAGLNGMDLTTAQILVASVTLTLFIPCIANFLIMIKERGMKMTLAMSAVIIPIAFLVGGMLNFILKLTGYTG
ncbi:MAG: ferrous iron transport protein B [Candidatus Marinimicrobia bacterium]|nr:ferrous iron transport protein B [Candidatus Neomarinimicrobiota bacterium]